MLPLTAYAVVVQTLGLPAQYLGRAPYMVTVGAVMAARSGSVPTSVHLPAVVDDFGNLVIVGGPL